MSTLNLPERWRLLWPKLGVALPPPNALDSLLLAWREPHRRYHTVEHLEECLLAFDDVEHATLRGHQLSQLRELQRDDPLEVRGGAAQILG